MRVTHSLLGALLLAGCSLGRADDTDRSEALAESTVSTASAETVQMTPPDDTAPDSDAEALVDVFVAFAHDPTDDNCNDLPLSDTVDLGLGLAIIKTVQGDLLRQPEAWQLDVDVFRAYVGPFSAFEALRGTAGP